jgi:hypothetical protein
MLGTAADNGLVDRMVIEIGMDSNLERHLRTIEHIVHWPRSHWHDGIAKFLNAKEKKVV